MPWEKITVDTVVNIKTDNQIYLGALLSLFDKIQSIFNDLKAQAILLEQSLLALRAQIDSEGYDTIEYTPTGSSGPVSYHIPYCSSVAQYNTMIQQFLHQVELYLGYKVPSDSGLAANVIRPWSVEDPVHVYNIAFKMLAYNWIDFLKSCIVDNMSVSYPELQTLPCVTEDSIAIIHIGCCAPPIYFVRSIASIVDGSADIAGTNVIYENFQTLLALTMPTQIHRLNALFNKNMAVVQTAINHINHIIQVYELI